MGGGGWGDEFHSAAAWHRDPRLYTKRRADTLSAQSGFPGTAAEQLQLPHTLPAHTHPRTENAGTPQCSPRMHLTEPPHPRTQVPTDTPRGHTPAPRRCRAKPNPLPSPHNLQVTVPRYTPPAPQPQVHPFPHALPAPSSTWMVLTSSHCPPTFLGRPRSPSLRRGWGAEPQVPAEVGGGPEGRNCIHMHGSGAQRAAARLSPAGGGLRPPS